MSVEICRHYLFPVDRLREALEAASEMAYRSRDPFLTELLLPDGSSAFVPFPYDDILDSEKSGPPYSLRSGGSLLFDYTLRVFIDEALEEYLDPEDDHYFVRHLKGGGRRALFPLSLEVRVEHPYAEFVFSNPTSQLAFVLTVPSSVAVLDFIGRQADVLVVYEDNPDGSFLIDPVKAQLPRMSEDEDERSLVSIVNFAAQCSKGE